MTSKSSPPYIPNIIFNSLISILAVNPDLLNIAVIQGIFKQNIKPKCQIKWEEQYGGNIDWTQIWTKLKKIKVTFSLICEVCNVHCKCFLKIIFQSVENCLISNLL
jgi:hypothetical protein